MAATLEVRDLHVVFKTYRGIGRAVNGVDLSVPEQQITGLVGETGSGKSVLASAMVNLVSPPGKVISGSVKYGDKDLLRENDSALQRIRGNEVALIVQNAKSGLNPLIPLGPQLVNMIDSHGKHTGRNAVNHALEMLDRVGIPDPKARFNTYPHQLSGGMAQRVMIAMALSNDPRVLIADEPTNGLDVTIQAQILDLISGLVHETGSGTLIITRDLGIVAQYCDTVAVLYAGQIVEKAPVRALFKQPTHPYSEALIKSVTTVRERGLRTLAGPGPNPYQLPSGCPLHPRCPLAQPICREVMPKLNPIAPGHLVRCHVRAPESS